ncbi:MAG: type II secretion system protein [Candidatus Vogelbacteria bacterium]
MKRGFTLVEILVAIGIIVLVSYLVVIPFASFRDAKLLDGATEDILSLLHEAQTRTLSSDGGVAYGIHFESDKITLVPDNKEVLLHNHLTISSISLIGGGTTIMFNRLTGATDESGTVTVSLVADNSQQRVIAISPAGNSGLK